MLLVVSTAVEAETILPEMSQSVVLETLTLPIGDRVEKLQGSATAREALAAIAFDKKRDLNTRWRSMTTMGAVSAKSFRWEIEAALKSREWFLRNAGLVAILHDDRERAINWSLKLLSDGALVVRTQAAKNLLELSATESRESMWTAMNAPSNRLGSESLWIRGYLAKALALWARPVDQKRFLKLLMDKDHSVQRWAIYGLEQSTGIKISAVGESLDVQRQKWLSRMSAGKI
jgi:hypothetical protein